MNGSAMLKYRISYFFVFADPITIDSITERVTFGILHEIHVNIYKQKSVRARPCQNLKFQVTLGMMGNKDTCFA